ncbi:tRNA glutamyl-Q(34) synthetase GluQRS [Solemya velesiana gill symbiont]|uniref:Glutamyl-Q tRNA(Asp) synthetase n=1 Tax=Solemya velesiana gill symbiont TaxID=1918948 RepID=A0A1T2KSQ3_9GAMM|nr:tRNA glutamyl-Q(34) synthetase GluQRS [Solemya velesiana gill symbiont]OOZ35894.1 tRNA glutamyl-Q(34) synthetase GluQRS [Solemya velesiana gill symbiont]
MSPQKEQPYIGRFAPSPSGPLHFGSLVAALGSYLDARCNNGQWLMRMEDIDPPREKPGAADDILRTLEAFGFEWDGEVLYQSSRQAVYLETIYRLMADDHAYDCGCSRREVAEAELEGIEGTRYPGTCRTGAQADRENLAVRLHTDHPTPIAFKDRICGHVRQVVEDDIGDFIIRRSDGLFAYQLAAVVDDAYQGINQVVRGADLLISTPRQILLQHFLDLPTPTYAHLPLVPDEEGRKLSKQFAALPVSRERPLPALLEAYKFLGQPAFSQSPGSLQEFWEQATACWNSDRVPCNSRHTPLSEQG